jgi:hypothetical protein
LLVACVEGLDEPQVRQLAKPCAGRRSVLVANHNHGRVQVSGWPRVTGHVVDRLHTGWGAHVLEAKALWDKDSQPHRGFFSPASTAMASLFSAGATGHVA